MKLIAFPARVWSFYIDGFRNMTTGRVLWAVIIIKLFIMFFILKLFFFPNFLKGSESEKGEQVTDELFIRSNN